MPATKPDLSLRLKEKLEVYNCFCVAKKQRYIGSAEVAQADSNAPKIILFRETFSQTVQLIPVAGPCQPTANPKAPAHRKAYYCVAGDKKQPGH
eukprot:285274-Pelagomonas_calceolata.AAC.1